MGALVNRLGVERSAYLRAAKDQPIHWHAWGADPFALARREDKPILLDVGAVWCHWCHVMDRESYEDASLAAIVNEKFVAIKVDRDERPDVDARYQKAVQAMTGQGGWPLTAFLLPDGRCFYGGTYFPPVDAHGRPSFRRVLEAIEDAYRTQRAEMETNARHIAERIVPPPPRSPARSRSDVLASSVQRILADHDAENGGFGDAPKFPHPAAIDLLLGGDAAARDVARFTLERMRAGGVYDQLAGGYHRYSVDAEWRVPHFEKMLYDNAGLLRNHHRAGDRETARDIARFLRDVLRQPDGGFGGSQDADVGLDDDGDFFTWTLDELREAIGDADLAKLLAAHYGVRAEGDMHHNAAKCVLRVAADAEALASAWHRRASGSSSADAETLAAAFQLPLDDARAKLAEGKRRLAAARAKRSAPFVDPTRYASWNGMAIQALLEMAEPETDAMALAALDAYLAGSYQARALLDDHAQMMDALLEAHLATVALNRPTLA